MKEKGKVSSNRHRPQGWPTKQQYPTVCGREGIVPHEKFLHDLENIS